ncbi:MAG: hypothetical protein ACUVYA_12680 [Planctomycetota bacterium]
MLCGRWLVVAWVALALLRGSAVPEDSRALLEQASKLKEAGDWHACLETLQAVVDRAAEDRASAALARCRRGECYLAMARPAEAEEEFSKVGKDFPEETETVLWAAVGLVSARHFQGKFDEALRAYEEVDRAWAEGRATAIQKAWATFQAGCVAISKRDPDRALRLFAQVRTLPLSDRGPVVQADLKRAEVHIGRAEYALAVPILRAVLEEPASPEVRTWARIRLAEALHQSYQYSASGEEAEKVLAEKDSGAVTDEQLAWGAIWKAKSTSPFWGVTEDRTPANVLEEALALPDVPPALRFEVLMELGRFLEVAGELEKARDAYGRALEAALEKKLPERREDYARLRLAGGLAELERKDEALAVLRMGLRDPNPPESSDREIARRIHDLLEGDERLEWREYLAVPDFRPDPTARAVSAVYAVQAPPVEAAGEKLRYESLLWGVEGGFSGEDASTLEAAYQALEGAPGDEERARVLAKITELEVRRAKEARSSEEKKEAETCMRKAAKDLAAVCARLVRDGAAGTAHWASVQAIEGCKKANVPLEAIRFAREAVAALDPERELAKYAFLKLHLLGLIDTYTQKTDYAELAAEARAVWEACRGKADATIENLGDSALMFTVYYLEHAGDKTAARDLLEEFEARCAEKYAEHIRLFHERLDEN